LGRRQNPKEASSGASFSGREFSNFIANRNLLFLKSSASLISSKLCLFIEEGEERKEKKREDTTKSEGRDYD